MSGSVSLVGAGPGAPDLLTLRGLSRLRAAEVVVHDRLLSPELLELAPAAAERIDVGKKPGGPSWDQARINALLLAKAGEGKKVVRLKGGDPFVFGRGSEEREACLEAGIPCEVVPGLSSALAAPALAGVPVTARGLARSFAVMTGHGGDGQPPLGEPALADTQIVLMGVERLGELVHQLRQQGRPADTPAMLIARASWPDQQVVRGTLGDIAEKAREVAPPAVLVVGQVAALGEGRDKRDKRDIRDIRDQEEDSPEVPFVLDVPFVPSSPLAHRRVALTRPLAAARATSDLLSAAGARVLSCSLIEIFYRPAEEVASALSQLDLPSFNWLVFTSRHGVEGFFRGLRAGGRDSRALAGHFLAVVGPGTAEILKSFGLQADFIASPHRAEALVAGLRERLQPGEGVLFPAGSRALRELGDGLTAGGHPVHELIVYETHSRPASDVFRRELAAGVDAVVFTSPSAVLSYAEQNLPRHFKHLVCLGPTTADAARRYLAPHEPIIAAEHSDAGLVAELIALLEKKP